MSTFVLVHGSFHGAWCWDDVAAELTAAGHHSIAVDLPGRGASPAPVESRTLKSYADLVCDAIDGAAEPVVLVGHSMGGVVITQAAEWAHEQIDRLVYVCAFLPQDGQSLLDLATTDEGSRILPNLVMDEPGGVHLVRPEAHQEVFYNDCAPEVARAASARLIPEALAPVATPVSLTAGRYGSVPRTYVRTTMDACLTPALQDRMLQAVDCEVVTLEAGHSPFLSMPDRLASALVRR